jgi:hypothetical protein
MRCFQSVFEGFEWNGARVPIGHPELFAQNKPAVRPLLRPRDAQWTRFALEIVRTCPFPPLKPAPGAQGLDRPGSPLTDDHRQERARAWLRGLTSLAMRIIRLSAPSHK